MNWPAIFLGLSLIFLGFALAVAFSWLGLIIGIPLALWSVALIDKARERRR